MNPPSFSPTFTVTSGLRGIWFWWDDNSQMTPGRPVPNNLQAKCWGMGQTLNDQDKLKSQPAILLFRSVDAIKQGNGSWRPLRDYSGDFM